MVDRRWRKGDPPTSFTEPKERLAHASVGGVPAAGRPDDLPDSELCPHSIHDPGWKSCYWCGEMAERDRAVRIVTLFYANWRTDPRTAHEKLDSLIRQIKGGR